MNDEDTDDGLGSSLKRLADSTSSPSLVRKRSSVKDESDSEVQFVSSSQAPRADKKVVKRVKSEQEDPGRSPMRTLTNKSNSQTDLVGTSTNPARSATNVKKWSSRNEATAAANEARASILGYHEEIRDLQNGMNALNSKHDDHSRALVNNYRNQIRTLNKLKDNAAARYSDALQWRPAPADPDFAGRPPAQANPFADFRPKTEIRDHDMGIGSSVVPPAMVQPKAENNDYGDTPEPQMDSEEEMEMGLSGLQNYRQAGRNVQE